MSVNLKKKKKIGILNSSKKQRKQEKKIFWEFLGKFFLVFRWFLEELRILKIALEIYWLPIHNQDASLG